MKKKTDSSLAETIFLAKKNNLIELAGLLSRPTRKRAKMNLEEIDKQAKEGEIIIIPGKVLGQGEVSKKIKVLAVDFSESAMEKLKKAKCEVKTLREELERNKKLEGKILKL